jgi:GGDEF domain-containing protein
MVGLFLILTFGRCVLRRVKRGSTPGWSSGGRSSMVGRSISRARLCEKGGEPLELDGIGDEAAERRVVTLGAACRSLAGLTGDPARPLGVSLGVAVYDPVRPETPEALLARADGAMYRVKQNGKGSFAIAEAPSAQPGAAP